MARVLSIQSHVVHGHVGNCSATFPLQLLGCDVAAINTVHLSNHTKYSKGIKGQILSGDDLTTVVDGLEANGILPEFTHVITGYIGSETALRSVMGIVARLRKANPDVVYVCDPVLGDNGHLYVPETLVQIMRDEIVPTADVLTPNTFEAELLTGRKLDSEAEVLGGIADLHAKGVGTVLLTSAEYLKPESLVMYYSRPSTETRFRIKFPCLEGTYTGTGDLVCALWVAWSTKFPDRLEEAAERIIGTMSAVLARTSAAAPIGGQRELKLVQSKADIENPTVVYRAEMF